MIWLQEVIIGEFDPSSLEGLGIYKEDCRVDIERTNNTKALCFYSGNSGSYTISREYGLITLLIGRYYKGFLREVCSQAVVVVIVFCALGKAVKPLLCIFW